MVTKRREQRLEQIQERADTLRAIKADAGHMCREHPIAPETMAMLLDKYRVEDVDAAMREFAGGIHDPWRGLC